MEDDQKSPIIERLRQFIAATGLSSSQFADKAGIPRPSLSQMLNGRNKSLNNNVLEKLYSAFPGLNIVWLLFGSGDMRNDSNIEISEPENRTESQEIDSEHSDSEAFNFDEDIAYSSMFGVQNRKSDHFSVPEEENDTQQQESANSATDSTRQNILSQVLSSGNGQKQIKSIIVLYSDSSFETFLPSSD